MTHVTRSLIRARRQLIDRTTRIHARSASRALVTAKPGQRAAWEHYSGRTAAVYAQLAAAGGALGATPMWLAYTTALQDVILPVPPADFLRDRLLLETMLVRGWQLRRRELGWLRGRLGPEQLSRALEEDPAGDPVLAVPRFPTSPTAIHHLYHLERFAAATGARAADADLIVEWGGGFGGFARTLRRTANAAPPAHVLIDLPIVASLQWTYLCTVLGEENVDLVLDPRATPAAGKVSIIPAEIALEMRMKPGVFVSLWALSETDGATQATVASSGLFDAEHLLLSFQREGPDVPDARQVGALAARTGADIVPVGVRRHNWYAFR